MLSLGAELIANDKPLAGAAHDGQLVLPGTQALPGNRLRRRVPAGSQLQSPYIQELIKAKDALDAVATDPLQLPEHQLRP